MHLKDLPQPLAVFAYRDRSRALDARVEIAIHPICAADVELSIERIRCTTAKPEDTAVLEEATDR